MNRAAFNRLWFRCFAGTPGERLCYLFYANKWDTTDSTAGYIGASVLAERVHKADVENNAFDIIAPRQ